MFHDTSSSHQIPARALTRLLLWSLGIVFMFGLASDGRAVDGTPQQTRKAIVVRHHKVVRGRAVRKVRRHHRRVVRRRHHLRAHASIPKIKRNMPPPGSNGDEVNRWWYLKRAWPNTTIDPDAYPNALAEARRMPVLGMTGKHTTLAESNWQLIGPRGIGGRVSCLATDPKDSNTFYAGAAAGGIWKTVDHGANWVCVTDTFASQASGAIAIDPTNPNIIYVGLGESDFSADSYPGTGMWKSMDGGATWASIGLVKTQYIARIVIDPTAPNTIYVASPGPSSSTTDTNRGIYKSIDGGLTWTKSLSHVTSSKASYNLAMVDLAMNPTNHNELVASALDNRGNGSLSLGGAYTGLWHTIDAGATWKRIDTISGNGCPSGVKLKYLSRGALCWVDSNGTGVLYAAVSIADTNVVTKYRADVDFYGLFRSTDPENRWTQLQGSDLRIPYGPIGPDSANILFRQGDYDFYLAANPHHPNEIYIGGIDVLRSTDWGRSFQNITTAYTRYFDDDRSQHSDQHALAFTAKTTGDDLLVASDGGVFGTTDFGANWSQLKGLPITMFYAIEPWWPALDHAGPNLTANDLKLFGGTQDNGTVSHGFSDNPDWDWINRGDGGVAISDPTDSSKLFTSAQLGQIFYRVGLDSLKPNLRYDLGALDTLNYNTQWHQFSAYLLKTAGHLTDSTEPCGFIPPIVLDAGTGSDIYTARTHVYHARIDYPNRSVEWSLWSPVVGGNISNYKVWYYGDIEAMAIGPRDASGRPMLWAGGSMVTSSYGSSLWRTTVDLSRSLDSAPVWIKVNAGFPANTLNSIVTDRSDSLTAFVGFSGFTTSGHVFKTIDGGKTWKSISGNLPNAPLDALLIDTLAEQGDPTLKNNCMIAATDVGVFVTLNGGKLWQALGQGLPNVIVHDIKLYKNWLMAGTDGRSAWALDVSSLRAEHADVKPIAEKPRGPVIDGMWPNPISGYSKMLHVRLSSASESARRSDLSLVDVSTGKRYELRSAGDPSTSSVRDLELPSPLASGVYFVSLRVNGEEVSRQKLTILN